MRMPGLSDGSKRSLKDRARIARIAGYLAKPDVLLFLSWISKFTGRPVKRSELTKRGITASAIDSLVTTGVLTEVRVTGVRCYKLVDELVAAFKDQVQ